MVHVMVRQPFRNVLRRDVADKGNDRKTVEMGGNSHVLKWKESNASCWRQSFLDDLDCCSGNAAWTTS